MNFAYVQGQEEAALSFFEGKLAVSTDPTERKQLQLIVDELRKMLDARGIEQPVRPDNALALSGAGGFSGS